MAENNRYTFDHKIVAELLVKRQGLHEGLWGIVVEFGLGATNISPDNGATLTPAALVPVLRIGIQPFAEANSLTVDAAIVNPLPSHGRGAKKAVAQVRRANKTTALKS